jgi:hypothetical protein
MVGQEPSSILNDPNLECSPMNSADISPDFLNELERKLGMLKPAERLAPPPVAPQSDKKLPAANKTDLITALKGKFKRAAPVNALHLKSGEYASDGSIYLGYFKKKDWFVTAQDAQDAEGSRLRMNFNAAAKYAKKLQAHGHDDWMVPSRADDRNRPNIMGESVKSENIMNEMFRYKDAGAFKGTYDENHSYWSSTACPFDRDNADHASFDKYTPMWMLGDSQWWNKNAEFCVRPVRAQSRKR